MGEGGAAPLEQRKKFNSSRKYFNSSQQYFNSSHKKFNSSITNFDVITKNALNRSILDRFKLSFFLNWSEFNQRPIPTNDMLPACLVLKLRIILCMGLICE